MGIITVLLVSVRQIGQGLIASRFSVFICKTTINFTFEYQDTKATFTEILSQKHRYIRVTDLSNS